MNKETRQFIWDLILLSLCVYNVKSMGQIMTKENFWIPFVIALFSFFCAVWFIARINKSLK